MKIAIDILPGLAAGVGRMQRETVRTLCSHDEQDLSVTVFSFGKRFACPSWVPPNANYCVSRLPGRVQRLLTHRRAFTAEQVCRLGRVDVILELNLQTIETKAPVVLVVADVSWRNFGGQYRTTFNETQICSAERAISRASRIITHSRFSADELILGGIPRNRISVVPHGVGEEFRNVTEADTSRIRDMYGLPSNFVLYVGGVNERKNIGVLVKALERLDETLPLILVGPMPTEPLAFWGLDRSWIRHLGYLPDEYMPGIYRAATVKVFPSKLEGFGLPLVEAMAVGTPVIASDIPVFREVAGDAACFFPPDDPFILANLIQAMFDSSDLRDDFRCRGQAHVAKETGANYGRLLVSALSLAVAGNPRATE